MKKLIVLMVGLMLLVSVNAEARYIKLNDASMYYKSYYSINVWARTTDEGKFPKVGSVPAGTKVKIIGESSEDYKVKLSNGTVGWINKMHFDK